MFAGSTDRPVLPVGCFDANAKANRYKKAGTAVGASSSASQPRRYFAAAHDKVVQLASQHGPLPNSASMDAAAAAAGDAADEEVDDCHPRLSCARESSLCSSISDECGVAGGVCSHGVPLLGASLAMPAPERFLYYDLLVSNLQVACSLALMYLDTACSYAKHWRRHMPGLPAPQHIRVPWWHAQGHGATCAVQNSGLYLSGELVGLVSVSMV